MRKIGEKMQKIGESFKRLLPVSAVALAASAALHAGNAQAILVFEFLEEGTDVRLNVSGSLTGLPDPASSTGACFGSIIRPNNATILAGCLTGGTEYQITGPLNYGTGGELDVTGYTGFNVFFRPNANPIFSDFVLDPSFVEGAPISGTGLITGQTLSSIGLSSTSGLLGEWAVGSDKIQIWAGPAGGGGAAVPGPLPLLGAAAAFAHSRRLRARLRAGSSPQA